MKKPILLLFIILLITAFRVSAENVLMITNPKSGETDVFRKGSFLVFELKADQSTHEGIIREIKDSSLVFDYSQVSFSEMSILAGAIRSKVRAGKAANTVGSLFIIAGSSTFNAGLNIFSYEYYLWPIGGAISVAGACVAGLGYMIDWATPFGSHVRVRNYRGWQASIMNEAQNPVQNKQISQPVGSAKIITPSNSEPKKEIRKIRHSDDDVYGN